MTAFPVRPGTGRRSVLAAVLVAVLAGCGPAATPLAQGGLPIPSSPVDGVVLTIDSSGLSDVHGFTLRTSSGEVLTFTLGTLEDPTAFPPGHLAEHQANALPVRVSFLADSDGRLVVTRLEDAPRPSASA